MRMMLIAALPMLLLSSCGHEEKTVGTTCVTSHAVGTRCHQEGKGIETTPLDVAHY